LISIQEFANKHLYPYKTHGKEIIPIHCPYCGGGDSRDKHTFALSRETGKYNCKRGSCGETGSFWRLCSDFGEVPDMQTKFDVKPFKSEAKKFKKPQTIINPAGTVVEKYLKSRGFSKETWEKYGFGEVDGNIAMPYYEFGA
jgi:twinkle protein